jgi:hypothetical protein
MKKYIYLQLIIIILGIPAACSQDFQWARGFGGSMPEGGYAIYTDISGNNYITGSYRSSMVPFDQDTLYCNDFSNIYLIKTDPNGNVIWAKSAGADHYSLNEGDEVGDITQSINNDIYVAGSYYFNASFDTIAIGNYGYSDAFIAKYNDAGHCLWVRHMGGNNTDGAISICTAADQGAVVCGVFASPTAYFGTFNLYNGDISKWKIFLAKYDVNGNCLWAKQSESGDAWAQIVTSNSMMYMTGAYSDSLSFGGVLITGPSSVSNIFLASFDSIGNINWIKKGAGNNFSHGRSICANNNTIYITGDFRDIVAFDTIMVTAGSPNGDMFVACYDLSGNCKWVKQINCSGGASGESIISDGNGGCYVTGTFWGTATFGLYPVNALSMEDMFVAHYDSSGNCLGVRTAANAIGYDLSLDVSGNCLVTGAYSNTTDFGGINLTFQGGGRDIFVAKANPITGITLPNNSQGNSALFIFANPTTGKCNITVPDEFINESKLLLTIYNLQGLIIQQQELSMHDNNISLNLEAEAKGVYTATLSNGKKVYTGKIVFE